jgi:hypothetical protein
MTNSRYWFPAKRYGWGWGPPATWQGWLVLLGWMAAFVAAIRFLMPRHPGLLAAYVVAMSALLLLICYAKGEPPAWRWGGSK